MGSVRLIPQFETWPSIKHFVGSLGGRITVFLLFFLLYSFLQSDSYLSSLFINSSPLEISFLLDYSKVALVVGLAVCSFSGSYRPLSVFIVTFLLILLQQSWPYIFIYIIILEITLLLSFVILKFQKSFISRRPLQTLIGFYFFCVVMTGFLKTGTYFEESIWSFNNIFVTYIWFVAYALLSLKQNNPVSPIINLGSLRPLWGGSNTPFGKNWSYLQRFESKDSEDLAITHIKGLKLLIWILLVRESLFLYNQVLCAEFQIPTYYDVFSMLLKGISFPWYLGWISLFRDFFGGILWMVVWGGTFVVCARMAGFRLLRNTVNPLGAKSIADFWNRYYYYFKELLVDFFFYPSISRYFKKLPKMRIFFATFMAAGFGNFLYHFLRDINLVHNQGWVSTIWGFRTYSIYCLILGLGIGFSQLQQPSKFGPKKNFFMQGFSLIRIILFYCIIQIFDLDDGNDGEFFNRFIFLGKLFGL